MLIAFSVAISLLCVSTVVLCAMIEFDLIEL